MHYDKVIRNEEKKLSLISTIASGGPYEPEYAEATIDKILEEYDKIRLIFKDKAITQEEDVSYEELDNLLDDITT